MKKAVFERAQVARATGKYPVFWTTERHPTQRAVLWVGLTCDVRCLFCYDKSLSPEKKEWVPLNEAIAAVDKFRYVYRNQYVDLTGGEPTLYPHIYEIVARCAEIGLEPTCITHGLHLEDARRVQQFKECGIHDFLVSVHGIGGVQDTILGTGRKAATKSQLKGLENLRNADIPFRINVTLIKYNKAQLPGIADTAVHVGASVVNFITFNPYFEWKQQLDIPFQARHSEIAPYLKEAIDICTNCGVEANVRYMPICQMKGYEQYIYTGFQLSFDPHEWDFNSWYDRGVASPDREWYLSASWEQRDRHGYVHGELCQQCALRNICDGFHSQYAKRWGFEEAQPYEGEPVFDPTIFIRRQLKLHYQRAVDAVDNMADSAEVKSALRLTQFDAKLGNRAGIRRRSEVVHKSDDKDL